MIVEKGATREAVPIVLSCADLLRIETPAEEMMFDGYPLPARGASLKVGEPKSGKTVLAVQEAIAVAGGKALFHRYRVLKPGPAMIVEHDDPGGAAAIKTIVERSVGPAADLPLHTRATPAIRFWSRTADLAGRSDYIAGTAVGCAGFLFGIARIAGSRG